jgi:hypothetical protein
VRQTCTDGRVFRYNSTEALTISDLTVTGGNRTGSSRGAGLKTFGPVTINDSAFVGNDAGGDSGAIWSDSEEVTIVNSTFADNNADQGGGAVYSYEGLVTATNSTFTGNTANQAGAVFAIEQRYTFVTMVGNGADESGAFVAEVVGSFGGVFADNTAQEAGEVCDASLDSGGYNWTDVEDCDFGGATDVIDLGGDPVLGALANNGGPTQTLLPGTGSPLIDAIPANVEGCEGTDQRGVTRPQLQGCDIGAVEVAPTPPPTSSSTSSSSSSTTSTTVPTTTTPRAAAATAVPRYTG